MDANTIEVSTIEVNTIEVNAIEVNPERINTIEINKNVVNIQVEASSSVSIHMLRKFTFTNESHFGYRILN